MKGHNFHVSKNMNRFGLALRRGGSKQRASVRFRFGSPLSLIVVVCGICVIVICPSQLMEYSNGGHRCQSQCRSHSRGDYAALGYISQVQQQRPESPVPLVEFMY